MSICSSLKNNGVNNMSLRDVGSCRKITHQSQVEDEISLCPLPISHKRGFYLLMSLRQNVVITCKIFYDMDFIDRQYPILQSRAVNVYYTILNVKYISSGFLQSKSSAY